MARKEVHDEDVKVSRKVEFNWKEVIGRSNDEINASAGGPGSHRR